MLTLKLYKDQKLATLSNHRTRDAALDKMHRAGDKNEADTAVLFWGEATLTFERNTLGGWRQTRVVYGARKEAR